MSGDEKEILRRQLDHMRNKFTMQRERSIARHIDIKRIKVVTPVFHAWQQHVRSARARKREVVGKVVRRLQNLLVWQAWRQWLLFVDKLNLMDRKTALMSKYLRRLCSSVLWQGFRTWKFNAEQLRINELRM